MQYEDLVENIHDYCGDPHLKWSVEEYDKVARSVENKKNSQAEAEMSASGDEEDDSNVVDPLGRNAEGNDEHRMDGEANSDGNESFEEAESDEEAESEKEVESEEDITEHFGVNGMCPLNALTSFHATTGFPPDLLHNLFEGTISQDLLGILRILSKLKWFTLEDYNESLQKLSCKSHESSNRPQKIPLDRKSKKLKGKACSIWVHIRNFPFIIRNLIKDEEHPVFQFGLTLHEITERITAYEFQQYEIDVLEELIIKYLDERKVVFEEFPDLIGSPKPKTHFLSHYPQSIRLYGPAMSYWTARYESRHRIAKNVADSAKNFRNISLTLSTRQQMRLCSVYYHGMFETSDLIVSSKATYKSSLQGNTELEESILPFMENQDFLCSKVEFRSQQYESNQLVLLKVYNPDEVKVGLILSILVKEKSAYFITKQFVAKRNSLRYFQAKSVDPVLALSDVTKLADFKPLVNQGTTTKIFFCLHHHASFIYS